MGRRPSTRRRRHASGWCAGGGDATTEARIRLGLREAMHGRTTLIIAHRLSTIALADEIVVLDSGRIAAHGQHDELLATSPVYRDIYEHGLLEAQFVERLEATA